MMIGVAQVIGMKPMLRSFFSIGPPCASTSVAVAIGKTVASAAAAVEAPTAFRKLRRSRVVREQRAHHRALDHALQPSILAGGRVHRLGLADGAMRLGRVILAAEAALGETDGGVEGFLNEDMASPDVAGTPWQSPCQPDLAATPGEIRPALYTAMQFCLQIRQCAFFQRGRVRFWKPAPRLGRFALRTRELMPCQPISPESRPNSIFGQRFITTLHAPRLGLRRRLVVAHGELHPDHPRQRSSASASSVTGPAASELRKISTMSMGAGISFSAP